MRLILPTSCYATNPTPDQRGGCKPSLSMGCGMFDERLVRRLSDGKVLPVCDEQGDEICVEELFEFADGGSSPRPLKIWQPKSRFSKNEGCY